MKLQSANVQTKTLAPFLNAGIEPGATLYTDAASGCSRVSPASMSPIIAERLFA